MTDSLTIICTLIRRRVWGSEDPVPEGIDWNAVLLESARNGVSAICCEAASALPSSVGPDFQTLLTWDLSVRVLKDGFRKRHEATQDMRALLENNGMRMLLLKGESFASVYPEPSLRECGDVDFMVFDRYADFLSLSERLGIKLDDSQGKHSEFEYEGVVFECHTHVLDRKFNLCDYRTRTLVRDSFDKAVLRDDVFHCWWYARWLLVQFVLHGPSVHRLLPVLQRLVRLSVGLQRPIRRIPGPSFLRITLTGRKPIRFI